MNTIDLTKQPPRSARARLGGYVLLPRMLDKGRASIAGSNGDYHYNCPLDQRALEFMGIDAESLKAALTTAQGDGEILEWIRAHQLHKRSDAEIALWSAHQDSRTPSDPDTREFFNGMHKAIAPKRDDIVTWADLLDLDDYVTFGGIA